MTCSGCVECAFDVTKDQNPYHHEIHITIQSNNIEEDIALCDHLGIKTIVVDLNNAQDFITSIRHNGSNAEALKTMELYSNLLHRENGLKVIRRKIETSPLNPIWMEGHGYFESHLEVICPIERLDHLRAFAKILGNTHMSKNAFKDEGDIATYILTYRRDDADLDEFKHKVNYRKSLLEINGYVVNRVIVEYCWFDDNLKHDDTWMKHPEVTGVT